MSEKEDASREISFLEALTERYNPNYEQLKREEEELFFTNSVTKYTKKVEMVGMEKIGRKQSDLHNLVQVSLMDAKVSLIDQDIGDKCPNLKEIDMTRNEWKEWNIVESLGFQTKKLEILTLNGNLMNHIDSPLVLNHLSGLKVLVLNRCQLNWNTIQNVEKSFPLLEELHFCFNNLSSFEDKVEGFNNLHLINLDNNSISDWSQVMRLSKLPSLQKLMISDNAISSVELEEGTEDFSSLKSLSISNNKIDSWTSIDHLNRLKKLDTLRCLSNPIIESHGISLSRQFVIARIKLLNNLNGSAVRPQERFDAEKAFVKWSFSNDSVQNARYLELVTTHGAPQQEKKEAQTLAEDLINVRITDMVGGSETISKKLPSSLMISNFKILCSRLFKLDMSNQRLFLKVSKSSPFVDPIEDDSRNLSYYGVVEDSEFIIENK
eukprot:TRINITY_DN1408_c0_g1_i1.p1 TRINITY_DN1408_c0_g1~~TRINITY_DN1408_c0_g1_i1.p1  ORF type:complete len:436 (+),score=187.30 TRINITY_DN1408_c0_g1_i1:59-1366(+)